jgi:hypothetical protein
MSIRPFPIFYISPKGTGAHSVPVDYAKPVINQASHKRFISFKSSLILSHEKGGMSRIVKAKPLLGNGGSPPLFNSSFTEQLEIPRLRSE